MPIVIDQMEVQPAESSSTPRPARGAEGAGAGESTPSEQQKEAELARLLRARHERKLRLKAH